MADVSHPDDLFVPLDVFPIPDWGLTCPSCRYPLTGLTECRCPECGAEFEMARVTPTRTRRRPPHFHGTEDPLPDFGEMCAACETALAGSSDGQCQACGRAFVLSDRSDERWVEVDEKLRRGLSSITTEEWLVRASIPYERLAPEEVLATMYGMRTRRGLGPRLRVDGAYYFDLLFALSAAQAERQGHAKDWTCRSCGEANPGSFDLCWQCGTTATDESQPS